KTMTGRSPRKESSGQYSHALILMSCRVSGNSLDFIFKQIVSPVYKGPRLQRVFVEDHFVAVREGHGGDPVARCEQADGGFRDFRQYECLLQRRLPGRGMRVR